MTKMPGEVLDALQIMSGHEVVYVAECRLHPPRQRLVARRAEQRVQPDETRTAAPKAGELAAEQLRVAAVPSVGHDQDDRPMAHHAPRPRRVERAQRLADARASAPVV